MTAVTIKIDPREALRRLAQLKESLANAGASVQRSRTMSESAKAEAKLEHHWMVAAIELGCQAIRDQIDRENSGDFSSTT